MNLYKKLVHGCEEASYLASRAREQKLPWGKRLFLSMHLRLCSCCSNFVHQSDRIDAALRHHFREAEQQPVFAAPDDWKAKLKEMMS